MTEEQIKEVMRLADVIENLAWSAGKTEQYHDEPTDYAEKLPAARAELEAYLRTIGEPAQGVNAELLEALKECVDLSWIDDSHVVYFDKSVMFGPHYDFSGVDGPCRAEFIGEHECIVWPRGGKWSAYCTYDGSLWFEKFTTSHEAKERCMRLLDKVIPDHPAMKARAAIARAKSAIETPAKGSPCAGHEVQQGADERPRKAGPCCPFLLPLVS